MRRLLVLPPEVARCIDLHLSSVPGAGSWMDVQSTIRGLTQDFATAFNTANYDQAAALFASDAYFLAPHRESVQGQRPIELMFVNMAKPGSRTCAWKQFVSTTRAIMAPLRFQHQQHRFGELHARGLASRRTQIVITGTASGCALGRPRASVVTTEIWCGTSAA